MPGSSVDPDRWLRRLYPSDAAVRLVCLPHAGGSASFFFPLSRALADRVRVLGVQYPGRQERYDEPVIDDLHVLADRVAEVLVARPSGPYALFGHSLGGALAYEVAVRLRDAGQPAPVRLFVSGRRAPSRYREGTVHLRDDDGIVAELRRLSGTHQDVLGDPDLLRLVMPALRGDYRAIETYRPRSDVPLDCPVTVLTGDRDPVVSLDEAHDWGRHTTGPTIVRVFSGGHFFLVDHAATIADLVRDELTVAS